MKSEKLTPKMLQKLKRFAKKDSLIPLTIGGVFFLAHPKWVILRTKYFWIPPKKKGKKQ